MDKSIHLKEENLYKNQDEVPIKAVDNGDDTYSLSTSSNKNQLGLDAWGRNKAIHDISLIHGVWTKEVSGKMWLDRTDGISNPPETNFTSVNGMLKCQGAVGELRYLHSRRHPRYQPNRGHLFSCSMILPDANLAVNQEFGLISPHSGVFFRINAGKVYIVRRTSFDSGAGYVTTDYPTEVFMPDGFDITKGNIFDIQMQWRGVGNFKYFFNIDHVEVMDMLGTLDVVSVIEPALPIGFTTDGLATMYCVCADITSEGGQKENRQYISTATSTDSGSISASGFNFPIIAVRVTEEFRGLPNNRDMVLTRVTGYSDQKSVMRIWATNDATAITSGTWNDIESGTSQVNETMTLAGFDTTKCKLVHSRRANIDSSEEVNNPDDQYGEFWLTHGDYVILTMHRENGGNSNAGGTIEMGEEL